jgi:DNA-binding Lrp family transcriptional regulator
MLIMERNNRIKLDKVDRIILAELDKNARIPSTVLARKVRKSRQTVEYRIHNLVKEGVITSFQTAINPHKIGHKLYKMYLKLRNIPDEKNRLIESLKKSGNVYWMGECSGSWDLIFALFAKNDYEFFEIKNEIISDFNRIIIEEEGQIIIDVKQYPKMYFNEEIARPTLFGGEIVNNEMDALDYAILAEIVNNARMSIVDLAENVKSTPIVVKGRMKKMETKGIIIQYRVGIDLNKLGLELYKAVITLDRYNKEDEKKMLAAVSSLKNTQYYIRNLWSIEPEFVVQEYQEYYAIIEKLKKEFPQVIRTVESVLMITDQWTPGFKNLLKK